MDLPGAFHGSFVDMIKCVDGTWTIMYNGSIIKDGCFSKEEANIFLVNFLTKPKKKNIQVGQQKMKYAA